MRVWWLIVWRSMVAGVVLGAIVGAVLGIIIALFQIDPAPLILHRFAPTPSPDQVEAVPAAYGAASISGSSGNYAPRSSIQYQWLRTDLRPNPQLNPQ